MTNHQIIHLIALYGYWAILVGVTVDSFGVPVPGEVMLLAASVYAGATHHLTIGLVVLAAAVGGVCGDNLSYLLGRRGGSRLLRRYGRFVRVDARRIRLGHYIFQRYGAAIVFLGRFIPVLHIWSAFLAGTHAMAWRRFALCNAIGCLVWASALGAVGYAFGSTALRYGGVLVGLSVPLAVFLGVAVLLLLRLFERRLQTEADLVLGRQDPSEIRAGVTQRS